MCFLTGLGAPCGFCGVILPSFGGSDVMQGEGADVVFGADSRMWFSGCLGKELMPLGEVRVGALPMRVEGISCVLDASFCDYSTCPSHSPPHTKGVYTPEARSAPPKRNLCPRGMYRGHKFLFEPPRQAFSQHFPPSIKGIYARGVLSEITPRA